MKKLINLFKNGNKIDKIFMIIVPIIIILGVADFNKREPTTKIETSSIESSNKEKPYDEERKKISSSTNDNLKRQRHSIKITDENNDGKLEVSISLDGKSSTFNETITYAIEGIREIDSIKKYHPELDKEIGVYNLDFYLEGSKKYSSVFDNTVSGDITSINLISSQTNESIVVTRDEINNYTNNKAKEAAAKKAETDRIEAEKKAEADKKAKKDLENANCIKKAKQYINYSAFSRTGLIKQLEYEGFSTESATYSVDSISIDWNEQCGKKAKQYMDYSSFSRSGLSDQLAYEGFSSEQIQYGLSKVGY